MSNQETTTIGFVFGNHCIEAPDTIQNETYYHSLIKDVEEGNTTNAEARERFRGWIKS
jgi:hypothetical protein